MNKKQNLTILVILLVLAGIFYFVPQSKPPIIIKGNLSEKDLAEITRYINRQLRAHIIRGLSWQEILALPLNLKTYAQYKIQVIEILSDDYVHVTLTNSANAHWVMPYGYLLQKYTNGWHSIIYTTSLISTTRTNVIIHGDPIK